MLILKTTNTFIKDLKRVIKRGKNIDKLEMIVDLLQEEKSLPPANRDHKLSSVWEGHRECHIEPDWLLIYRIDYEYIILERTGSHADLFDK